MSGISGTTERSVNKKPNNGGSERVELKVVDQYGREAFYKIWRDKPLSKLMNAYCEQQAVVAKTYAFLLDGRILHPHQTPDQVEMENGAEISAMLHMTGGCN